MKIDKIILVILLFFSYCFCNADLASINDAISTGATLEPRLYIIDGGITVPEGKCLKGQNGTIVSAAGDLRTMVTMTSNNSAVVNITFEHPSFSAPYITTYIKKDSVTNQDDTLHDTDYTRCQWRHDHQIIRVGYDDNGSHSAIDGFTIDNVTILNSCGCGIRVYGIPDKIAQNGIISNCCISNTDNNGILIENECKNIRIVDNYLYNNREQDLIYVRGGSTMGSENIIITGNRCINSKDFGIEVGENFAGSHKNIIISNNIVDTAACVGISFRSVNNGIISNNSINNSGLTNNYAFSSIYLTGDNDINENAVVSENVCKNSFEGVHVTAYKYVNVTDNVISATNIANSKGIYFETEPPRIVSSCKANGNIIDNCSNGILLAGYNNCNDVEIENNKIVCSGILSYGIQATCLSTQINVYNNSITNSTLNGISFYRILNSLVSNNHLVNCANTLQSFQDGSLCDGTIVLSWCNNILVTNSTIFNENTYSAFHVKGSINVSIVGVTQSGLFSRLFITRNIPGNEVNTNCWIRSLDYNDYKAYMTP